METAARSICPFCSMGCTWRPGREAARPFAGEPPAPTLDYDPGGGPNRGSLCAKGNMSLELMTDPGRLEEPLLREEGRLRPASWEEALGRAAAGIAAIRASRGGRAVGILLGPRATLEEAAAAAALARAVGTPHLDLCEPEDHAVLAGLAYSPARPARVEDAARLEAMNAILVVGDLLSLSPCIARPVLDARYRSRRHALAVLGPLRSRTAWFGRPFLRCEPASEAEALAMLLGLVLDAPGGPAPGWAEEVRRLLSRLPRGELERGCGLAPGAAADVAAALRAGPASGVLLACEFGTTERMDLVAGLAALVAEAAGARFLAMLEGADSLGIRGVLDAEGFPGEEGQTAPEMLEAAVTGDLRALLVLGADPVAAFPGTMASQALAAAALCVVSAPFPCAATDLAGIVLPSAVFGEKGGTVRGAFGTPAVLVPAMAPPGRALPEAAILAGLAAALGLPPAAAAAAGPGAAARAPAPPTAAHDFFSELELFLRTRSREARSREPGSHLLLAEASAANAAEGSLTGRLSWARYAHPRALLGIPAADAAALGAGDGDRVRVRSNWGQAVLPIRVDRGLPPGVVTAPHRDPAVRGLLRWRREPVLRSLDLRPDRVSLERAGEADRA